MTEPLLELEDVGKAFRASGRRDRLVAVDAVSFAVAPGETVGLVGGSGAGKSTIARMVAGLLTPGDGVIRFEGRDLAALGRRERRAVRRRVHLVFQDPYASLAPGMRIAEVVAEPLAIHGVPAGPTRRQQVLDALGEVRLLPPARYADRYPHELSGGERQRVALARALVVRPRLILADEPTAMLDASIRADLLRLMADLQAAHQMAYLYVTHDLALARGFCDRLLVLDHGRLVEQGPTHIVLSRPEHAATKALARAARRLHALPPLEEAG